MFGLAKQHHSAIDRVELPDNFGRVEAQFRIDEQPVGIFVRQNSKRWAIPVADQNFSVGADFQKFDIVTFFDSADEFVGQCAVR